MKDIITHRLRMMILAIVILMAVVGGFIFFYSQLRSKSKAAPTGTAILSLTPVNNPPMAGDGGIKIAVELDPNGATTGLYSFETQVTFDPAKIEFQNAGGADSNVILASGIIKGKIELLGENTIRILGTRTGTSPFSSTNKKIADITFKMKQGKNFPVTFSWAVTALQVNHIKVPLTISSNTIPTSSSSVPANGARMSFIPTSSTYAVGNLVLVDVMVNTAGKQIGSVNVNMTYDNAKLTHVSTLINTSIFNGPASTPGPSGGNLSFSASRTNAVSGNVKVATLRFTAKAVGTAELEINVPSSTVNTLETPPKNVLSTATPTSFTITAMAAASSGAGGGNTSLGGGSGVPGEHVESNGDILHINSATFDGTPFRYEQAVKLKKGEYILSGAARVYTAQGRGVLVTLACGESDCGGGKKLHQIIAQTPLFALSEDFQIQTVTFTLPDAMQDKKLVVRIFAEDGSEADFDYVSLMNVWGGEFLTNWHFENYQKIASPRLYPQYWEMDAAGQVLSTVDKLQGVDGALFINSSSRK